MNDISKYTMYIVAKYIFWRKGYEKIEEKLFTVQVGAYTHGCRDVIHFTSGCHEKLLAN
jgi:hypothetical protein